MDQEPHEIGPVAVADCCGDFGWAAEGSVVHASYRKVSANHNNRNPVEGVPLFSSAAHLGGLEVNLVVGPE